MNFMTGRNLCFAPGPSKAFLVFSENATQIPAVQEHKKRYSGFKWGYDFKAREGRIPDSATYVEGTVLVISPAYTRHVTHFAESTIPWWHALLHSGVYPVHAGVDSVFLKQSRAAGELEWNMKILRALIGFTGHSLKVHDAGDFQHSELTCLRRCALVGMGLHEFGFFANEHEARQFRRHVLRTFHVPALAPTSLDTKSRCLVLQRAKSRRLLNHAEIVGAIELLSIFDCSQWSVHTHGRLEDLAFEQQMAVVSNTHFLVGLHGSGLVNSIFLPSTAVVVDLLPPKYLELEWHNFASKAGVQLFFLHMTSTGCAPTCDANSIFETSQTKCRTVMACNHELRDMHGLQVSCLPQPPPRCVTLALS